MTHGGVVEEDDGAGLEVGETKLVRASLLRVELEAMLRGVPGGVDHVPGLVAHRQVEHAVPTLQNRAFLDQHETAAERVARHRGHRP